VLRLLLGRQAQLPCDETNLPTRVAIVEAVGVTRVATWHTHNEARRLAQSQGLVVTVAKAGVVVIVEAALVLLRRRLPFLHAVRLAAVAPRARPAAVDPQAQQRRPAIARLPHVGRRGQAQALRTGDNVALLALAEAVMRRGADAG
jgi:hypothetical protein